jgi:hypothetical protein
MTKNVMIVLLPKSLTAEISVKTFLRSFHKAFSKSGNC